jgi:hypothetical protein
MTDVSSREAERTDFYRTSVEGWIKEQEKDLRR